MGLGMEFGMGFAMKFNMGFGMGLTYRNFNLLQNKTDLGKYRKPRFAL